MQTEMLVLVSEKKINMLDMVLPYIKANIGECNRIFIISKEECRQLVEKYDGILFINEDEVLSGLSFFEVKTIIENICGDGTRAGWYLQQFLKMAWALNTESEAYIVWDIDTIPLHPISFTENGKYLFTIKIEHHMPYFDTLKKLTGINDNHEGSFVAEHMIIVTDYMKELIQEIMDNDNLIGSSFYERILRSIDIKELTACGFSEFETYGNYVIKHYPNIYAERRLRTCRQGSLYLCKKPTKEMLEWAARDYDIISLEGNNRRFELIVFLSKRAWIRKLIPMRDMVRFRKILRNVYGKIVGKKYIDFE